MIRCCAVIHYINNEKEDRIDHIECLLKAHGVLSLVECAVPLCEEHYFDPDISFIARYDADEMSELLKQLEQ